MQEHPIESLMEIAMNNIKGLVDVNTIIGEPIELKNNVCIIPISKVAFGFAAGGSEFTNESVEEYNRRDKDEEIKYKNPFGGGSGAGVGITPVAFLIVQEDNVKLIPVEHCGAIDKIADYIPDIINKIEEFFNNKKKNKNEEEVFSIQNNDEIKSDSYVDDIYEDE